MASRNNAKNNPRGAGEDKATVVGADTHKAAAAAGEAVARLAAAGTQKAGKAAQTDATEQIAASGNDAPPPTVTPHPVEDVRTGEEVNLGGFSLAIVGYDPAYPIDQILANPWNYRIHPPRQQQAARASLQEFGWVAPLIINQRTEHLIDGHLRLDMAMKAGCRTAPVVFVNKAEEEERAILAVYDPMTALAVHDSKMHNELLMQATVHNSDLQAFMLSLVAQDVANGAGTSTSTARALNTLYGDEDDEVAYDPDDVGRRPDDKLATYQEGAVRQIMLHLTPEDYEQALINLDWLRDHFQVDTNAQAILQCMAAYMRVVQAQQRLQDVSEQQGRKRPARQLAEVLGDAATSLGGVVEAEF